MKAGISNIWVLGLMVAFLLCFAAYITVSINYTASFKMKNEILSIIEKHHGITNNTPKSGVQSKITSGTVTGNVGTLQTINMFLAGHAYNAKGDCNNEIASGDVWYGMTKLTYKTPPSDSDAVRLTKADKDKKFYYCFSKFKSSRFKNAHQMKYDKFVEYRYKFKMFYRFDVPALSEFLAVQVEGTTKSIADVKDGNKWLVNTE